MYTLGLLILITLLLKPLSKILDSAFNAIIQKVVLLKYSMYNTIFQSLKISLEV